MLEMELSRVKVPQGIHRKILTVRDKVMSNLNETAGGSIECGVDGATVEWGFGEGRTICERGRYARLANVEKSRWYPPL